ncbi:HlyD family type I secretion periplasmic adaptor subunit [Arenibaculum pallidiluteum]|uniref:HlyD family type I secretion periplasmic adaptor subunit n=1 Tax=Arenibaculum pallidiluteum TaxID=2812559 RepID=UPI001A9764E9|nr:HlyD family type I secretion periplasmic adaptor subunit [Arenibaculum pallidiluteum]
MTALPPRRGKTAAEFLRSFPAVAALPLRRGAATQPAPNVLPGQATATGDDPHPGTDGLFAASFALVAVLFGWAAFAELNVTSTAPGDVVPLSYNQSVQHFEGGIVREILVAEGDAVRAGQALVELDETKTRAELDELQVRLSSLRVDIARLEAEVAGRETVVFPTDLLTEKAELTAHARELFRARRERLASDVEIQRQDIAQREQEVAQVRARIAGAQTTLGLIREQLSISDTLLKREITNRMRHIDLLRDEVTVSSGIASDRAAVLRAEAALSEARSKLLWIARKYEEEARSALDEARRNHSELSQRLARFQDNLARSTMRAPVDGIVKTLAVSTRGAVVKPGETVVELVPRDGKLVVDAHLPVQDIGYVQPGQPVVVTLAGGDASRFGHIEGHVLTISPDTLLDEKKQPYYKVRVELPSRTFQYGGNKYEISPGVKVVCSILTGTRTILGYVFSPLFSGFGRALQER